MREFRGATPHDKKIHSYHNYLPLLLDKGKGIKGIGLINDLCTEVVYYKLTTSLMAR